MQLQTWVTFRPDTELAVIQVDDEELLDILGKAEDAVAVRLAELMSSVKEALQGVIDQEGELQIELRGSLELKGSAGISHLFFNVGGEASRANTMTVTLKTKIFPSHTHPES